MRYVSDFDDPDHDLDARIGARARSLKELTRLGLPVPPGFAISDVACRRFLETGDLPAEMWDQVASSVERVRERAVADEPGRPVLFVVRSSPPVDMPGLLGAALNLGWTGAVETAVGKWASPQFATDLEQRFLEGYARTVRGITPDRIAAARNGDLRALIEDESQRAVPTDPMDQIREGIESVFASWDRTDARKHRRSHSISDDLGTGAVVHLMVHGTVGETSGVGVAFSRDPASGRPDPAGTYRVMGRRPRSTLAYGSLDPVARSDATVLTELIAALHTLEGERRDAVRLDFVNERGTLWLLEGRPAERTARAATRIAVDLVEEGVLDHRDALLLVEANGLANLLHPQIVPGVDATPIAIGTTASPGAASGVAVFDAGTALQRASSGESVVLVRRETSPEDLGAVASVDGILTSHGGRTSHAAVAARGLGTPAVTGATTIHVDILERELRAGPVVIREGEAITIDGASGAVYQGSFDIVSPGDRHYLERLLRWADEVRRLEVRANVDSADGATIALAAGAQGIGLARTEYMFSGDRLSVVQRMLLAEDDRDRGASLEELEALQTEDFERLLEVMDGKPVVVRLLDPPLHEFLPDRVEIEHELASARSRGEPTADLERLEAAVDRWEESNPMLGLRGVRLAVVIPDIYRIQVLAALEAVRRRLDAGGDPLLQLMIPLVASLDELQLVREMIEEEVHFAGRQLDVGIGTMIELPRAALIAERLALESDFFSFGTNDLTQTTLGLSRDDAEEAFLEEYLAQGILDDNPFQTIDRVGVGRLIRSAIEDGRSANPDIEVGVCGEHGGDPRSIQFFHEIGVDYVSCSPPRIPVARLAAAQAALLDEARG
ncbi:MAG: putative PEP-binding protein [Acidimicrobiia bacterium]